MLMWLLGFLLVQSTDRACLYLHVWVYIDTFCLFSGLYVKSVYRFSINGYYEERESPCYEVIRYSYACPENTWKRVWKLNNIAKVYLRPKNCSGEIESLLYAASQNAVPFVCCPLAFSALNLKLNLCELWIKEAERKGIFFFSWGNYFSQEKLSSSRRAQSQQ